MDAYAQFPVTSTDVLTAIAHARTLASLDAYSRAIWNDWTAQRLTDEQTQRLAEAIEARRGEVRGLDTVAHRAPAVAAAAQALGRPSWFPPKRKESVSPDRRASLERRRLLAASGVMPPALAARFTTGELAALRIVADEARDKNACRLSLGEIAARAGVGITTARRALREAAGQGLVTIEERRRSRQRNLPNVVRIVSAEWRTWIARGARAAVSTPEPAEGGGRQKAGATDKHSYRMNGVVRVQRGRQLILSPPRPPLAAGAG
jgi:hypothetical protein